MGVKCINVSYKFIRNGSMSMFDLFRFISMDSFVLKKRGLFFVVLESSIQNKFKLNNNIFSFYENACNSVFIFFCLSSMVWTYIIENFKFIYFFSKERKKKQVCIYFILLILTYVYFLPRNLKLRNLLKSNITIFKKYLGLL